jgi:hypothetical protein
MEGQELMYYPDLSPYQYLSQGGQPIPGGPAPALNIGWLDHHHFYPQGETPDAFIAQLWIFCQTFVNQTLGYHKCEFCQTPADHIIASSDDQEVSLGTAEIWVFGNNGRAYAAPNLIYHYVVTHHYQPPDEFIQAVLESPLPDSPEYDARASQYMWGKRMLMEKKYRRS